MLKSYFLVALKHLAKQKLYTLINVIGLAVGLACFILIGLFVRYETSYDRQFANGDRIYRVSRDFLPTEGSKAAYLATAAAPIAPLLKEDFREVEHVARLFCCGGTLRREDGEVFTEDGLGRGGSRDLRGLRLRMAPRRSAHGARGSRFDRPHGERRAQVLRRRGSDGQDADCSTAGGRSK